MRSLILIMALFVIWGMTGQMKKVKSYELATGQLVEPGDIVTIGKASNVDGTYQFIYTKPSIAAPYPTQLGPGYEGGYFEIDEIQQPKNPLPGVSSAGAVFKMGKQKMMVSIDQAIETGEATITKP